MVAGVWIGNDDNTPMRQVTGGTLPALIWKDFLTRAGKNGPLWDLPGEAYSETIYQASYQTEMDDQPESEPEDAGFLSLLDDIGRFLTGD